MIDLRGRDVDGAELARAIAGDEPTPLVECPEPAPLHEYVGHVHPAMGLRTGTALAAAARSRGATTRFDDAIAACRDRLDAMQPARPSLPDQPTPVPADDILALRERVAAQRGRVDARESADSADAEAARADLRETVAELTERVTEQTAAEQARERRRDVARSYRDALAERRRLADRLANLRREARADLVEQFADPFAAAVDTVPGSTPTNPFDADPVTAALAVLSLADVSAPVVLEVNRFPTPLDAAARLDVPLCRC